MINPPLGDTPILGNPHFLNFLVNSFPVGSPAGGASLTLLAQLKLPALGFGGFCLQVTSGGSWNGRESLGTLVAPRTWHQRWLRDTVPVG